MGWGDHSIMQATVLYHLIHIMTEYPEGRGSPPIAIRGLLRGNYMLNGREWNIVRGNQGSRVEGILILRIPVLIPLPFFVMILTISWSLGAQWRAHEGMEVNIRTLPLCSSPKIVMLLFARVSTNPLKFGSLITIVHLPRYLIASIASRIACGRLYTLMVPNHRPSVAMLVIGDATEKPPFNGLCPFVSRR